MRPLPATDEVSVFMISSGSPRGSIRGSQTNGLPTSKRASPIGARVRRRPRSPNRMTQASRRARWRWQRGAHRRSNCGACAACGDELREQLPADVGIGDELDACLGPLLDPADGLPRARLHAPSDIMEVSGGAENRTRIAYPRPPSWLQMRLKSVMAHSRHGAEVRSPAAPRR